MNYSYLTGFCQLWFTLPQKGAASAGSSAAKDAGLSEHQRNTEGSAANSHPGDRTFKPTFPGAILRISQSDNRLAGHRSAGVRVSVACTALRFPGPVGVIAARSWLRLTETVSPAPSSTPSSPSSAHQQSGRKPAPSSVQKLNSCRTSRVATTFPSRIRGR